MVGFYRCVYLLLSKTDSAYISYISGGSAVVEWRARPALGPTAAARLRMTSSASTLLLSGETQPAPGARESCAGADDVLRVASRSGAEGRVAKRQKGTSSSAGESSAERDIHQAPKSPGRQKRAEALSMASPPPGVRPWRSRRRPWARRGYLLLHCY